MLGERLLEAIANLTLEQKWDAILVDEAHTFSPSWFKCCVAALKDSENGDLMIVSDGSQSLYQRGKFTWKSVGVNAQGRTKKLTKNYRNTKEILSAAWSVIQSFKVEESEEDVTFPVIEPSAALRNGERPNLHLTASRTQEIEAVIAQIQKLHNSGYEPRDIAVVYQSQTEADAPLLKRLRQQLDDFGLGCYWVTENTNSKFSYSNCQKGVRLITALSSLGLEFKAVLILWAQKFDYHHLNEPEAALVRRQLYVAMTRAQDLLYLFASGNSQLISSLKQAGTIDIH